MLLLLMGLHSVGFFFFQLAHDFSAFCWRTHFLEGLRGFSVLMVLGEPLDPTPQPGGLLLTPGGFY
jgi:hypothetical protein